MGSEQWDHNAAKLMWLISKQWSFSYSERLQDARSSAKPCGTVKGQPSEPSATAASAYGTQISPEFEKKTLRFINRIYNPHWGDWWDQTSDTWLQVAGWTVV